MAPILHHGDCIDIFKTLSDNSVDLIVTDPPYGIKYKSGRQVVDRKKSVNGEGSITCRESYFEKIDNDDRLHTEWISEAYRVLKESSALYVFSHWSKWDILYNSVLNAGFNVKNMIVLNKSNHGAGDLFGSFSPKHELILFATKGRHELRFPEGRIDDIWNVPVKFSGSKRFHPNEKPVSWILPAILNSSDKEQVILDPFLGSGTTGIAAIGCGRQFIGVEKDQTYFDIAQKRIADAYEKSSNDLL